MSSIRKQRGSKSKAQIALSALKNEETLAVLAKRHGVHPIQIGKWRKELIERAHELFVDKRRRTTDDDESRTAQELYEQIGRLKVENDFLKKKSGL